MTSLDFDSIFKCKDLSASSINTYKTKFIKLNDDKPVRNLNFLLDIEGVKKKIEPLRPNTQRTYYIAICSILKCMINNKQANKNFRKIYDDYSKILEDYNIKLKDQTEKTITEGENWMTQDRLKEVYDKLKENHTQNQRTFQDYLILSLYYLNAPRRNKDYTLLKVVNNYNDKLPNDFNYFDVKNKKFIFNNYKTAKKYNRQEIDVNDELYDIINEYIKQFKVKNNDFLLYNLITNEPLSNINAITLILNRIFNRNIGSSMLRKFYLSNKYGDNAKELIKDVEKMGTSVSTANNNYIKK